MSKRYVYFIALWATVTTFATRASADDLAFHYRGVTDQGKLFSGVTPANPPSTNLSGQVSTGFEGNNNSSAVTSGGSGDTEDEVIGSDDRQLVRNTTDFPHRAIGFLSTACTGTLIGPRHVLTAAHCVYSVARNTWYTGISFSPARNANQEPYGNYNFETSYAPQGYTDNHNTQYDYALVVLQQPIGNSTGWMTFGWSDDLGQNDIHIVGYPSDLGTGTEQWESECSLAQANPMDLRYPCATSGGDSGSAVWTYASNGVPTIYGIHVYALTAPNGAAVANSATRITQAVYQQLQYWMSRHP